MSSAVVIQCFVKQDTLEGLCQSLLACEGNKDFHVIFWTDVPGPGKDAARHARLNVEVRRFVERFAELARDRFASITLCANERNLGTCRTCEAALDFAFQRHDFVVFTEDDTVFAPDALAWFAALRDQRALDRPEILALAGESIFFDGRRKPVPPGFKELAREASIARKLFHSYVSLNFVPSTCFATSKAKWARFGKIRGQPRGDEDVCDLCRQEKLFCIFPVLARVVDIGMNHQEGYSVGVLGTGNVREIKNTYLTSADVPALPGAPKLFIGNRDRLFEESVNLAAFLPVAVAATVAVPMSAPAVVSQVNPWKLWCFSLRKFGDSLTPYLFTHYKVPFEIVSDFDAADLLGIGSNLDRIGPNHAPIVVWSSGFMYPKARPMRYGPGVRLLGVRGQHTRANIALADTNQLVIGDGGLLVARSFDYRSVPKTWDLGIMPHMSDVATAQRFGVDGWPGVKVINVFAPIDEVLQSIASCRRIVSSSLQGIITADGFGIPNVWAVFTGGRDLEGDGYKYLDHASALGYEIQRVEISHSTTRDGLIAEVDGLRPRPLLAESILDELEMTLSILRGAAKRLCTI